MADHKHNPIWMPKGPTNINIELSPEQAWYRCSTCGAQMLMPKVKRKSKTRKKK